MYRYFNNIFIGSLLVFFHINIGEIRLFPNFVGLSIIFLSMVKLYKETDIKDFKLSSIFLSILVLANIVESLLKYNYILSQNNIFHILFYFFTIFDWLYVFYFVSGSIKLIEENSTRISELFTYFLLLSIIVLFIVIVKETFFYNSTSIISSILFVLSEFTKIYIFYFYRNISNIEVDIKE